MTLRTILAALLVLALCPSAFAAPCTRANAETATVLRMLKHPRHFEGRCIRLKGITAFRSFFDDLPSLYAVMTGRSSDPEPQELALYAEDETLGGRLWKAREPMEIVGTGSTCETMGKQMQEEADRRQAEAKKEGAETEIIFMMGGPCHYHGGPIVHVTEAVSLPGKARMSGETERAKYGDAHFLASPRDSVRKPPEALIAAMKARDPKLLAGKVRNDWNDVAETVLFDPEKSPFAFLIGASHDPQTVYFDIHKRLEQRNESVTGTACICRKESCTGEWPITFTDMRSDGGDLPFKCFDIYRDGRIEGI